MKRVIAAVLIGSMLVFSFASCFGTFNLTKKLHDWNGSLGNKFVNTLVFWVFCIIPVYGVAVFVDAIVLNLIEFWSGGNPMSALPLKDGSLAEFDKIDDATVHVKVTQTDGTVSEFLMVRDGDRAMQIRDKNGAVLSQVEIRDNGTLVLTADGKSRVVSMRSAEEIARLGLDPGLALDVVR